MTKNRDPNRPSEEMSLGRKLQDFDDDTGGENYLKREADKKENQRECFGESSSQATDSCARRTDDTTDQNVGDDVHSRLDSTLGHTNELEKATKSNESIRVEKKSETPTEDEQDEKYEELICLVRQFYVERPANPAAIGHHNIETC